MSREVNGVLLKHLIQMAEQDNQDDKLEKLLEKTIENISFDTKKNIVTISFTNKIEVVINFCFDSYRIFISDSTFYSDGDTAYTSIGEDRLLLYLKQIAQFKYAWRKK